MNSRHLLAPFTLILGLLAPPPAHAARVAILVDEVVDGRGARPSDLEAALAERLAAKDGVTLIAENQLEGLRSADGKAAFNRAITSADADLVLRGSAEMSSVRSPLLPGMVGYDARASLEVYAADSAEILGTVRVSVQVPGADSELMARAKATSTLADQLLEAFLQRYPDALGRGGARRLRVMVKSGGPIAVGEEQAILAGLSELSTVESCEILSKTRDELQLAIRTGAKARASDLAAELSARPLPLVVVGYSDRELLLDHDPSAGVSLALVPRNFRGPKPASRQVRGFAFDALLGLGFVRHAESPPRKGGWLELRGSVEGQTAVRLRVVRFPGSRPVATVQEACGGRELTVCAVDASSRLAGELAQRRASLLGSTRPPPALRVAAVESDGLFPARLGHYLAHPFATLVLENQGELPIERLRVQSEIRDIELPTEVELPTIAPGETVRVPLRGTFIRSALEKQSKTEQVSLDLELTYETAGQPRFHSAHRPLLLHERHAMSWQLEHGASVGGFVDGHAPLTRSIADATQARLVELERGDHPLAFAAGLALALADLRYVRDPKSPFDPRRLDFVRFPDETLTERKGDCDDLAVLFASALEAGGRSARLLLFPTHVMVAFGTGLPPDRQSAIDVDHNRSFEVDGELYVPLETTRLGAGFEAAWRAGAERLRMASVPPIQIDLTAARALFPAASLGHDAPNSRVELKGLEQALERLDTGRKARTRSRVTQLLDLGQPDALAEAGTLLAQLGELDKAAETLRQAEMKRSSPRSLNNLGNVELIGGAPAAALELYESALVLAPNRSEIRMNAVVAAIVGEREDVLDSHLLELSPAELRVLWRRISPSLPQPAMRPAPTEIVVRLRKLIGNRHPELSLTADEAGAELDWPQLLHWL